MSAQLVVGFMGTTAATWNHLAGCVHSEVVTGAVLSDPDDEKRAALTKRYGLIQRSHSQPEPLLADSEVSVVVLGGMVQTRAAGAREALLAGKHVILEAPPAQTAAELDELSQLAAERDRLLYCALDHLHMPAHLKLDELRARAPLSAAVLASATQALPGTPSAEDLLEAAYQSLVILQHFIEPAKEVRGATLQERALGALVMLGDGVAAQISIVGGEPEGRGWGERRIFAEDGVIWLRDNPEDEMPLIISQGGDIFPVKVKAPPDVYLYAALHSMEHLLEQVYRKQADPERLTEARTALATWEALQQSAAEGGVVALP